MGFDISISMNLYMCSKTGKPYYLNRNKEYTKVYDIPSIVVPVEHRRFCADNGHIYAMYVETAGDILQCEVDTLLEEFPSWNDIVSDPTYENHEDYWTEVDHDAFHAALSWFSKQDIVFTVNWSY